MLDRGARALSHLEAVLPEAALLVADLATPPVRAIDSTLQPPAVTIMYRPRPDLLIVGRYPVAS